MTAPTATSLLLAAALLAAGCDPPGKPDPAHYPKFPAQVSSFPKLFAENCAGCHGAGGKMGPAPPLSDPLFRAGVPEAKVREVVTNGRAGTSMPAFLREKGGALTASQIEVLVNEIKGISYQVIPKGQEERATFDVKVATSGEKPAWGAPPKLPEGAPPYLRPAGETGSQERGAKLFGLACAGCHGDDGKGSDTVGAINDHAFLTLTSDQALRRIIITGRADLGMPNYADSEGRGRGFKPLSSQDVTDLVTFLDYWRQGR